MTIYGLLPDHEILRLGSNLVEPFEAACVQPASYDLTLHPEALLPPATRFATNIDLRTDHPRDVMRPVSIGDGFDLLPGACLLASTVEHVYCPADIAARVEGKSSLGRLFLAVHVTAGWVDAGWRGQITLEVVNHGPWVVRLWAGMKIAQVNFTRMASPCAVPYGSPQLGSHYQAQEGPTAAAGGRASEEGAIPSQAWRQFQK
jgi:dCTP deaminase